MQEKIIIRFDRTVAPVDIFGFRDVVSDVLQEQGSNAKVEIQTANVMAMEGMAVSVEWTGSYEFTTPNQERTFNDHNLAVTVRGSQLNHDLLMKLLAYRAAVINRVYRSVLVDLVDLATQIEEGDLEVPDATEFLRVTLENAVNEFPPAN